MRVALGNFLFRHRNALFPFAFLIVLLPGPWLFADPLHAFGLGAVLALLGQCVRAATIGLRYIIRGGRDRKVHAEDMVTTGVYAHCRNPMYVGNLLILSGVAVAANTWSCVLLALPLFSFAYVCIVAAEEQYLHGKFGVDYESYMRSVPRWLPRLRGITDTFRNSQFHWRRVVLKEYGTPFGWLLGIFALPLWNLWRTEQLEERMNSVYKLLAAMLGTVAVWVAVRVMKKSRTLVAD